jgi:peptidoglycan hydrolase-like protein with peptidoglycan-binding domain
VPRRRRRPADVERNAIAAAIVQHPREFVGIVMGTLATLAILINALFLQHGPHPAPIFATRPWKTHDTTTVVLPPPNPLTIARKAAPPAAPARANAQLTYDIQRALAQRGFYDGAVDGIWGAKTDAAARAFVKAGGLTVEPQPSEDLLRALTDAGAKDASGRETAAAPAPAPTRRDPIATMIAPSKRILAVQYALADFGYGQIKPTGVIDGDTRAAIEKFQRDRGMPVDGRMSDRLLRELAAMTGRPLEQ